MLKIKDNVDLKELERFGFKSETQQKGLIYENKYSFYNDINKVSIYICTDLKIVEPTISFDIEDLDVLYDLINEGMLEKVVEDENKLLLL